MYEEAEPEQEDVMYEEEERQWAAEPEQEDVPEDSGSGQQDLIDTLARVVQFLWEGCAENREKWERYCDESAEKAGDSACSSLDPREHDQMSLFGFLYDERGTTAMVEAVSAMLEVP